MIWTPTNGKAHMLADAQRSGLSPQHCKHAGFVFRMPGTVEGITGASYEIPYWLPTGAINPHFSRYRLLEASKGFHNRTPKYHQPAGTRPYAYFPHVPGLHWGDTAHDTRIRIIWTEGEKKALAACLRGLITIGLGGVYGFRSAKHNLPFLPELDLIDWAGRHTDLCFDSDLRTNTQVLAALHELCGLLTDRGAIPHIIWLPEAADSSAKVGLDDWLITLPPTADVPAAFTALPAEPFAAAQALLDYNTKYALVTQPMTLVEEKTGKMFCHSDAVIFTKNIQHTVQKIMADGTVKLKVEQTFDAWLKWQGRREFGQYGFLPGQPTSVIGTGGVRTYNSWRPPADAFGLITPIKPPDEVRKCFLELVTYLCHGEPQVIAWLLAWIAYPHVHVGAKMTNAVLIYGHRNGTGKTLLGQLIGAPYGQHYRLVRQHEVFADFNQWQLGAQFALGDEVMGSDRRANADLLKGLITQSHVSINQKNIRQVVYEDHTNYYFTSNHPNALYLDPDDRRFAVLRAAREPLPKAVYTALGAWLDSGQAARHLTWLALHAFDISAFNPYERPPMTEAKQLMLHHTRSELDEWAAEVMAHPDDVLKVDDAVLPGDLWTSKELTEHFNKQQDYQASPGRITAMGMAFGRAGAEQQHIKIARVWVIRRPEFWATQPPAAFVKHYLDSRQGVGAHLQVVKKAKKY